MNVAGLDVSTKAIDLVLLDLDTDRATWHRYELEGADLIERVRSIRDLTTHVFAGHSWAYLMDDVLAVGIERPAGKYGVAQVSMAFGAVLVKLPPSLLVQPWQPSEWRKAVGLPGNCTKQAVAGWAFAHFPLVGLRWEQDAYDALAIAWATRSVLVRVGGEQAA